MLSSPQARSGEVAPVVAVLIATCDRPGLLAQRSLTSVQRQTRRPDILVVVDDSDPKVRRDNRNIVNDLRLDRARIVYITNSRTRGASGAWNTGLEWLRRHAGGPGNVFTAVLDYDDEWEPGHLALCSQAATSGLLDMIAPAIVRISNGQENRTQVPGAKTGVRLVDVASLRQYLLGHVEPAYRPEGCEEERIVTPRLPRHTLTATLLWRWLIQKLAGISAKAAAEKARLPFALETVYRVGRKLRRGLDRVRPLPSPPAPALRYPSGTVSQSACPRRSGRTDAVKTCGSRRQEWLRKIKQAIGEG